MPCVVTQAEEEYYEREDNFKKFGERELDSRITTRVACEMGKLLKELGADSQLSEVAKKWLEHHEKEDAKRKH